jgi:hypothetical protein
MKANKLDLSESVIVQYRFHAPLPEELKYVFHLNVRDNCLRNRCLRLYSIALLAIAGINRRFWLVLLLVLAVRAI